MYSFNFDYIFNAVYNGFLAIRYAVLFWILQINPANYINDHKNDSYDGLIARGWIGDTTNKINPPLNINVMHNFRIIDGFACIGGNTITFAKNFGKVVSIELNPLHFNLLKENLETLDITNVEVHNDDFFHYINTVSDDTTNKDSDIVFLDLPWNCKHYRRIDYFNLKANNMELPEIVNMLHGKGYKYVVVKGPLNLNVGPLYKNSLYNNLIIHKNEESYICMVILY